MRIAIGLVGFSLATSIAFGIGAYWAADIMEVLVLEQNIGERARRAASAISAGKEPLLPEEDWYYGRRQSDGDIERQFSQLQNGSHHDVMVDGGEFHVWIEPLSDDRLYLFYDLAKIEAYEGQLVMFLVSIGAVLSVLAFALGLWLTPWVAKPVTALAERVLKLSRDAERLDAPDQEDTDLAVLAAAIDTFLRENHDLVERERAFTGMASHELRNPVASIGAALDLIALNPAAQELAQPLGRIRRNSDRMNSLIEVLLDLARDQNIGKSDDDMCRPADLIREIVNDHLSLSRTEGRQIQLDLADEFVLNVRPAIFRVIAINLISNALAHSTGSQISIRLNAESFSVDSEGDTESEPDPRRLGLGIVDVICARFGWAFEYSVNKPFTTATVRLG